MSSKNRVIWSEGLFIKPQHFQQQQRYFEYITDARLDSVHGHLYGVAQLEINPEYLGFGRIAIQAAKGVMQDGTVFNIPQEDVQPNALEVADGSLANQIVYLALSLRSDSITEVTEASVSGNSRYVTHRHEARDIHTKQGDFSTIEVSPVHMKLMFEKEDRSAYTSVAIAKILEKRPDGSVVLDPHFIPCHYNVVGIPILHRFIGEMAGMMRERAKNIAQRIGSPSQGGVADVSDFMLLQALNRMQPALQHMSQLKSLHPEQLYLTLVSICGELFSFTDDSRLAPLFTAYDHDMPVTSFTLLMNMLRQSLSIVLEPKAVSLQLQKRKYGLMVAPVQDPDLIKEADFILAVRAKLPLEELKKLFLQQTKISSVEKIRELISLQLPGVGLTPLPVAPRQLPYHAGYTYFQLDRSSKSWEMLNNSTGFAFHVAGDFPELELQFWAIRN
ncbi:type VI secretion system baseplate subunit TssK [Shewanella sp. VB17]|uniref:type VI secretion system baseplate subunit TssK n=1 Tax=Shewanella sp. VB17 TaxID=2739432 RepID=UPI0015659068|nr:type VI secretion system baseplate subunit TssK [Shewanella sp. VB17]NRD73743.1 type VI secretion system baseplate subunit TssK [Shewanella sp. VB17]